MIVTQTILDLIRNRFNSLLPQGADCTRRIETASGQYALEVSVREAFSSVVTSMPLSDEEELKVQEMEKATASLSKELQEVAAPIIKLIRTRHAKRLVLKTPGQILHEAFHTDLNRQGKSSYGKGCWDKLSPERRTAWEASGRILAQAIVSNVTDLKTPAGDTVKALRPLREILTYR